MSRTCGKTGCTNTMIDIVPLEDGRERAVCPSCDPNDTIVALSHEELMRATGLLRQHAYAVEDTEIVEFVDELLDRASTTWRDCPECGWGGTIMAGGKLTCLACGWKESKVKEGVSP